MSAQIWRVDEVHSSIQFSVRHLMLSNTVGRFTKWNAELALDESDLTKSSVAVSIEAGSVDTGNPQRDGELRATNFFDAEKYPRVAFRSRAIAPDGADRYRVTGDLTIRDVTREVTLDAALGGFLRDPRGAWRTGLSARARLNRKDFGMVWNRALETGGVFVGEQVEIQIELEAIAATPPPGEARS